MNDIKPGQGVAVFRLPIPMNAIQLLNEAVERIYGTGNSTLSFNGDQIQVNAPADGFGPLKTGRRAPTAKATLGMKTAYMKVREDKLTVTLENAEAVVQAIMHLTRLWFEAMGGINYVEFGLQNPEGEVLPFVYCVQRRDGDTPHVKRQQAEAHLYDVQSFLAKTLSNIEDDEAKWSAADVREFITDAIAMSGANA
jgi:hypothetical protein